MTAALEKVNMCSSGSASDIGSGRSQIVLDTNARFLPRKLVPRNSVSE
jgi:hypothetical protein